jgi:hypothetical protein
MKLEHLLRDTHFVLRTDHKNLTFINTDFREKVKRWKLAIQHFDFQIEYLKGTDNIEADGFSRLCPEPTDPADVAYLYAQPERLPHTVYQSIAKVHNALMGHGGVEKTISKLIQSEQTWKGMRRDVKHFISQCDFCQKVSSRKLDIQTMPYTLASYSPFERIYVDTIGPLPSNDDTKKYILVIIDAFSRFVLLRAIPDTKAKGALEGLIDWIGLFGIADELVSDNGTQFANAAVDELLAYLGTDNVKIQAYSSEENGIVERVNKEVNRHMKAITYDRKQRDQWYRFLPLVQRIINASVHSSLGVSPAQIVFGNATNLDRQLLQIPEGNKHLKASYGEYMSDMLQAQHDIIKSAAEHQHNTDALNIKKRVEKAKGKELTEFPIDSYVLVNYEGTGNKPPSKLHTFLRGPLRVVSRDGPIYTLQNLVENKLEDFHVKLLHPFNYDEVTVDPSEVAQHDKEYFGLTKVLSHRFTSPKERRSDLEFLIHWKDEKEPKWESWNSTFGSNEDIQKYLMDNQLRRYIPQRYTWPKDHPEYVKPTKRTKARPNSQFPKKKKRRFGKY